jgi:hydroxymethylbilane synthase
MDVIRVGTRGSHLALTQTNQVVDALRRHHPRTEFEVVVIKTTGDARQNVPFSQVGTKGMFVKEIEEALLSGAVDVGVHSMKDMPGALAEGLALLAVPAREDARDALLSDGRLLGDLPVGARVGTSSLRRRVQIQAVNPGLEVLEFRGNLDTRIRKMREGEVDAIILACAGLERLGWADRITERLPVEVSIPAPGQGALCLEGRAGDRRIAEVLAAVHDEAAAMTVAAERAFQAELNAGCTVPAGAHARLEGDSLHLIAMLSEEDGSNLRRVEERGPASEAEALGRRAARRLRDAA